VWWSYEPAVSLLCSYLKPADNITTINLKTGDVTMATKKRKKAVKKGKKKTTKRKTTKRKAKKKSRK